MQVRLKVMSGPHEGREFVFDGHENFLVGRGSAAHFRLPSKDPYFSRLHFLVEINPPACRLMDLGSTNGTSVNGVLVQTADLGHGDRISGGDTTFEVFLSDFSGTQREGVSQQTAALEVPNEPLPSITSETLTAPAWQPGDLLKPPAVKVPEELSWSPPGYRCLRILGRGGMGIVYLAQREADQSLVAVKTLKPASPGTASERQRFLREVAVLEQLQHPAIVRLQDAGEAAGILYFVMDYIPGQNLEAWSRSHPGPTAGDVLRLAEPVLAGLDYAHRKGFVHRDLKPTNLLVQATEPVPLTVLADFGLARVYESSTMSGLTLVGDMCGTPRFMAPEQITDSRRVLPACDQYGLATSLYWLLTRRFPIEFSGSVQKVIQQILVEEPVPIHQRRPDLPEGLGAVFQRALHKKPDQRFATLAEFGAAYRDALR